MKITSNDRVKELREWAREGFAVTLNQRQLCDLELLANGGLSPLKGFMGRLDYEHVLNKQRLVNGTLWPIPIVLSVAKSFMNQFDIGDQVGLRNSEGFMLAVLHVTDIWQPNYEWEAESVYGTLSREHPGVRAVLDNVGSIYVGGSIEIVELPIHYGFESLWHTPDSLRASFHDAGWSSVIAFQTSQPIHRLERDLMLQMAIKFESKLLLHPAVGESKPGDLAYYARVKSYQAVIHHLPAHLALLSLLPLAIRLAGPREALWHGIIHKNYGCSAFIVGPDYGSPPLTTAGNQFYEKYSAQEHVMDIGRELDILMLPVEEYRYALSKKAFLPLSEIKEAKLQSKTYSHHDLKQALADDMLVPAWFSFPEVIDLLANVYPANRNAGIALFFTGLSGSGKSTLAGIMQAKLIENGQRPVTLLDGDVVRQHLSSELGFSRAHRDLNIRRIGFVANEIIKNGGIAICAPIAPYREIRREIRNLIHQNGIFIEIYLSTPLRVCEQRDRKGLYAKARAGVIPHFTGISDPYEAPEYAELVIDTSITDPVNACHTISEYLINKGFIR